MRPQLSLAPDDGARLAFERDWLRRARQSRRQTLVWSLATLLLLLASVQLSEVTTSAVGAGWTERVADFIDRLFPVLRLDSLFAGRDVTGSLARWYYDLPRWLAAMRETIEMAFVGTVVGGAIALLLAFLAARNLTPHRGLRVFIRRGFDFARSVPDAVLALLFAVAFALGPVAGALTLIVTTVGALGKLFSEAMENAHGRQIEAVKATGGSWILQMRYGVIPQLLPQLLSYWLLRMETNLAIAASLGIIGAGGIGIELDRSISFIEFDTYLAILLLTIACIFMLDMMSELIRHRLTGPSH